MKVESIGHMAYKARPQARPPGDKKTAMIIKAARQRAKTMAAAYEAKRELERPGRKDHALYESPTSEELFEMAEKALPSAELKKRVAAGV